MPYGETLLDLSQRGYETPYQFTGYEKDQETGLHYAEARYYDSWLSIFNSTDPMWYKYPHLSPYNYCANNPINVIDPTGMDSLQRNAAVNKAQEYVSKNPGDSYLWGGQGQPGKGVDCSGMVRSCVIAGEEVDPYIGKSGSGVKRIIQSSQKVENLNDMEVGNVITLDNSKRKDNPTGHIGIVESIKYNKSGNVTGYTIIDSGGSAGSGKSGPRRTNINVNGKGYWDKRVTGIYKWDTKPDNIQYNTLSPITVYAPFPKHNITIQKISVNTVKLKIANMKPY